MADPVVRLKTLDGAWETVGTGRLRGIIPERLQLNANDWGSDTCSFTLRRDPGSVYPDLTAYTDCEVEIQGQVVWSGRVWETPTKDGGEFEITVQGRGWPYHLDDDVYERVYVHTKLSEWRDVRTFVDTNLNSFTTSWAVSAEEGKLVLALPNGVSAGAGTGISVVLDLGPHSTASRIVLVYKGGGASNLEMVIRGGTSSASAADEGTVLHASTVPTTDTTGAYTFTTPRRYLRIGFNNASGGSLAGSDTSWVQISSVLVFYSTAYESGNASVLKASTVVQDARDTAAVLLSTDNTGIETTSFNIPEFAMQNPQSPREVINAVNAYHAWITKVDVDKRLIFKARPAAPLFEVGDWSGSEFEDASANSGEEIYNRVIVEGREASGTTFRLERTQAEQSSARLEFLTSPAPTNPSFDTDTTGWTAAGSTITRDTATFDTTPASGRWEGVDIGDTLTASLTGDNFVKGSQYRAALRLRWSGTFSSEISPLFAVDFGDLSANDYATLSVYSMSNGVWTDLAVAWAPRGTRAASAVSVRIRPISTAASPQHVDSLTVAKVLSTLADRRGFRRTKILPVGASVTVGSATQLGDTYLGLHRATPLKGSLSATGPMGVRRVVGGQPAHPSELLRHTGELVRLSHRIDPDTGAHGRDGMIAAVSYDHDQERASVSIDNERTNFEALLARLAVVVGGA